MISEHVENWLWRIRGANGARHFAGISAGTAIAVGGLALSAASTGLSLYSSMQQGNAAAGIAGQNAAILKKNAEIQLKSDRMQALGDINDARLSETNADISFEVGKIDESNAHLQGLQATLTTNAQAENSITSAKEYGIDATLQRMSANTLNSYGRATEMQGREEIARFREQGRRVMAVANNRVAKSGIVAEGSPLAVLADNAAHIELKAQDIAYETELTARDFDRKAYNERLGAKRSLLSARQETRNARTSLKSGRLAQVGMNFAIAGAQLEQKGAQAAKDAALFREKQGVEAYDLAGEKYKNSLAGADITASAGSAQQRASQLAAIGTGISGVADLASGAGNIYNSLPANTST